MWGVEKAYLGGLFAERVCGSCWTTCTQSRGVWDRCRWRLLELPYAFYPLTSRPSPLWMKTCGHLLSRSSLRLGKILSHSPWTCVWRLSHHRGGSHLQRNQVRHGVVSINRDDWEMLVLAYAHRCRFFCSVCMLRARPPQAFIIQHLPPTAPFVKSSSSSAKLRFMILQAWAS